MYLGNHNCTGPGFLWVILNPSDLQDPIAQVMAGEDIDLDEFCAHHGPDAEQREHNIAANPYTATQFFHFMCDAILEALFGIKTTAMATHSQMGVLGRIQAYFGMVESQGCGTLHLHLLLWLAHAPSSDELIALLKTEKCRAKVVESLDATIRGHLPGLGNMQEVHATPSLQLIFRGFFSLFSTDSGKLAEYKLNIH